MKLSERITYIGHVAVNCCLISITHLSPQATKFVNLSLPYIETGAIQVSN